MSLMFNKYIVNLVLLTIILLVSCGEKDATKPTSETGSIQFFFKNETPLKIPPDSMNYINAAGNTYTITLLEYMITKIVLHRADGTVYDANTVNYINEAEENTKKFKLEYIPNGEYVAISFIMGVDSARNVNGGLPNTTIFNNMEWPSTFGGGYHFFRMEGNYIKSNQTTGAYALHCGNTNQNTDFPHVHRPDQVKFMFNEVMTFANDEYLVDLSLNANQLMEMPHIVDFRLIPGSIMSNDSIQHILSDNAVDIFSIKVSK